MSARESRPVEDEATPEAFGGAEVNGSSPEPDSEVSADGAAEDTEPLRSTELATKSELLMAGAHLAAERGASASLAEQAKLAINLTADLVQDENRRYKAFGRTLLPQSIGLHPSQAAELLLGRHEVRVVVPGGTEEDDGQGVLAVYQEEGERAGTYRRVDLGLLDVLCDQMFPDHDERWAREVSRALHRRAQHVPELENPSLVPMANCWLDYATGERLEFSPELVTLSKFATRLPEQEPPVPEIVNPDGTVWNAKTWFEESFPDIWLMLLQVIGMCLRPGHVWRVLVYLVGKGSNGKGTFLELVRTIVGQHLVLNVPPSKFGNQFILSQAISKRVNLVDEDDVGKFIEEAATLKMVVSQDPVSIDRKHRDPITARLRLANLISLNEVTQKFKDKSAAMDDRQVFIPFAQRFNGPGRNQAIKHDYVKRPEVAEWFAYQALVKLPRYDSLEESAASLEAKQAARLESDVVAAYWEEFGQGWERDFLPFEMLYAHFAAWSAMTNRGGSISAQKTLTARLKDLVDPEQWVPAANADGKDVEVSICQWLTTNEPTLAEFDHIPEIWNWDWVPPDEKNGVKRGDEPTLWMRKKRKARGFVRPAAWARFQAEGVTPVRARQLEAEEAYRQASVPANTDEQLGHLREALTAGAANGPAVPWHEIDAGPAIPF